MQFTDFFEEVCEQPSAEKKVMNEAENNGVEKHQD